MITLTIDDKQVEVKEEMTVLEAAKEAGIYVPTLCYHPSLSPYGGCRLCVVEIEKMRGLPTSCTTPAGDGMVVRTNTPQLQEFRQGVLELILTEHPHVCLDCWRRERCEPFDICNYSPNIRRSIRTIAPWWVSRWSRCHFHIFRSICSPLSAKERKLSFDTEPP